jgi:hypothetical protein
MGCSGSPTRSLPRCVPVSLPLSRIAPSGPARDLASERGHYILITISCSGPAPAGFARLRGPLN